MTPEHHPSAEELEVGFPYREGLTSSRGLSFDGTEQPCGSLTSGEHRLEQLDRGQYRLELQLDDRACTVDVTVGEEGSPTTLDLAELAC